MVEQIKKILDRNNIKYNVRMLNENDKDKKFEVLSIDIPVITDTDAEEVRGTVTAGMWIVELTKKKMVTIYIPRVKEIRRGKREKIKNYVLDFNTTTWIGAFGIPSKSKFVQFNFNEVLTINKSGQAFEINKIPNYIKMIGLAIGTLREEIESIESE